jgi:manganese/zinc/iron transport system substrate-binding protein
MDRRQFSSGLAAFCMAIAGCRRNGPETESDADQQPLNVVATVGMVADLVRRIGGQRVQVTQLMGSGVDPHLYKATRDDLRLLMQADVIVAVGLLLEGRLQEVLSKLKSTCRVVFAADQIPAELLLTSEESGGHPDPHVWMDVQAWSHCLAGITSALSAERPQYAAEFDSRARELALELQELHAYGAQSVATIPQDRRVLITSHDAFRYFGRAYGLEVMGIQGISTESEAGLLQVNALVDLLVQRRISAVFIESSVPQKNMAALIEGAQARGHQVSIGGELYSDAMGEQGTWEGTYPGMLDHNITTITRSLGGQVPERGWAELRLKKGVQP